MPTISVILPTYNRAHFINKAINSVLNQTFDDFELIIVDDGSTDNSCAIVQNYNDNRVTYIKHEINLGGNAARNTGIKISKGNFISFIDSDDEWFSDFLKITYQTLSKLSDNYGVVYTGGYFITKTENKIIAHPDYAPKEGNHLRSFIHSQWLGTQRILIKKLCFSEAGYFDENLKSRQDWEFFLRLSQKFDFCYIDEPLIKIYDVQNSVSKNNRLRIESMKYILKKHNNTFKQFPREYANHLKLTAFRMINDNSISEARLYLFKSLILKYNTKVIFVLVATLFGNRFYNIFKNIYHNFTQKRSFKND